MRDMLEQHRLMFRRAFNQQIVCSLESLRSLIPPQILLQNLVLLKDAFGHIAPFHLDFIHCPEALLEVLKIRFREKGSRKVENGEFILQNSGADDINLSRPWAACFFPGQHVDMSVTARRSDRMTSASCPICQHEHVGEKSVEITW